MHMVLPWKLKKMMRSHPSERQQRKVNRSDTLLLLSSFGVVIGASTPAFRCRRSFSQGRNTAPPHVVVESSESRQRVTVPAHRDFREQIFCFLIFVLSCGRTKRPSVCPTRSFSGGAKQGGGGRKKAGALLVTRSTA